MEKRLAIWFDEESDFLEFRVGRPKKGFFKDVGNDIWERVDEKGNILGFAILNFTRRLEVLKKEGIKLPVGIELTPI